MFASPSQVLFTFFGLNIYYYGIIMAFAIASGILVSDFIGTKFFNYKKETFIDLAPYVIICGIIWARAYYCLMDFEFYLRFPTEIFAIRHGGISIHGAILGGILGIYIFSLKKKLSFKRICDISSIGLVLGQSIGRWGNFFNSEAYGTPTDLPWKMYISPQYRKIPYLENDYFHPAFLYESILNFLIFLILIFVIKKCKNIKEGNLALIYLILYSCVRIGIESIRIDSVRYICNIPVAILVSIGIIIIAVMLLIYNIMAEN